MGKMGKVNTRELKDFERKLKKLQDPDAFLQACAKELAGRLLEKVIKRTPVGQYPKETGKLGGTLRRAWTAARNSPAASYADALTVQRVGSSYIVEIINPVEYASYVEYGHRTASHEGWVQGKFMMTISEQELQSIAPKVLEHKLKKYMEGLTK